ncbi:hypothetical protein NDU88_000982 [Pleurodeles waltl]|uniref:Uncharacterized protein n=1 Tax=Pleurodeles waltl TaxID=8319 RepID=A0AAV7W042_PLEWA|nr:hypothetical protein NDU88_000982 [Pleurodeles waltl]
MESHRQPAQCPHISQSIMHHGLSPLLQTPCLSCAATPLPGAHILQGRPACRHPTVLRAVSVNVPNPCDLCRARGPPGPPPSPSAFLSEAASVPHPRISVHMEALCCFALCRSYRSALGPCRPRRSAALSSTRPPSPALVALPAPGVPVSRRLTCCLALEPTDIGGPALMPPFFPSSGDHLGPPPGLYLKDILWAQMERSAHASAIFTSQATMCQS